MTTPILTKTTSTGATLTVTARGALLTVSLDGTPLCSGSLLPLQQAQGAVTHHIGRKAGFTAAEVATIEAALYVPPSLRDQRRTLAATLAGMYEEREAAFERGHRSDGSYAHALAAPWDAEIEAAAWALCEFDGAHPEVRAEIAAEKAERTARFLRTD